MEPYKKYLLAVIAFIAIAFNLNAQREKIDSLVSILQSSWDDTSKVIVLNELAWQYKQVGENEKAIQYEKKAIPLAKQLGYKKGEAKAYANLGIMLNDLGKSSEAIESHRISLKLREDIGDLQGAGNSCLNMGNIHSGWGNFDSARYFYLKSLKIHQEVGDEYGIANCFNGLGNINRRQNNFSESLQYHFNALKLREKLGDPYGVVDSYSNLGGVYNDLGNFTEALRHYRESIKRAEVINYKRLMAISLNGIAMIFHKQENLPEALKHYFLALRISEEIGYKRGISMCNENIGFIYHSQKNNIEAAKYTRSALLINQELGNKYGQIKSYTNLGNIYQEAGEVSAVNIDTAIYYHEKALQLSEELGAKSDMAIANYNLGYASHKRRSFSEILKYYSTAMKIAEEINLKYSIAKSSIAIAETLVDSARQIKSVKPDYTDAINFANRGLAIAQEINSKELIIDAYCTLADSYRGRKEYERALYYTDLFTKLNDSLLNTETARKLEGVRIQYEVEKATAEEKAKQETQKAEMKITFDRREDSIKYQQKLIAMQLDQQSFISKQQEQDLKLKQASLELLDKQNELNRLNYLKSQAELETEQTKREEKEQELTIANQEKSLQTTQLNLQKTQLNLKENQIKAEKRQRLFYMGGIALLILLFVFIYRNIRIRERTERLIASERLKTEKASAAHTMAELELQSLRAQLNPHFMFNSLNAIQELILKEDNENSHLYLSRFSELLRMLLDNANQPFVSLRKELNLLELYLSLERLRIPDLKYSIEIDSDVDVNKTTIPNMMLQPYIENAIWHGLSPKKGEKNLFIRINKKGDGVICKIEDNGVGRKVSSELKSLYRKQHRSKGMELLSKRFNLLSKEYGTAIQTDIEDLHDNGTATGTKVSIILPHSLTEQTQTVYS